MAEWFRSLPAAVRLGVGALTGALAFAGAISLIIGVRALLEISNERLSWSTGTVAVAGLVAASLYFGLLRGDEGPFVDGIILASVAFVVVRCLPVLAG